MDEAKVNEMNTEAEDTSGNEQISVTDRLYYPAVLHPAHLLHRDT